MNPWIGVDLDGTLAEHYWPHKGPYDPLRIGEPLMPMVDFIQKQIMDGVEVRVFTARVGPAHAKAKVFHDVEAICDAIRAWTKKHIGTALEATCMKDYGMVALYDDRAYNVEHNTGRIR